MAGDDDDDAENDTGDTNNIEASWTWSQFAQYARLCADPALLGKALLHELEGGCGGAAAEVALLVAAHRCLTLAADAEGAAALLSHVREQAYVVCLDFIAIIIFIIVIIIHIVRSDLCWHVVENFVCWCNCILVCGRTHN